MSLVPHWFQVTVLVVALAAILPVLVTVGISEIKATFAGDPT